jgi:ribonucleoside-triphosphate reductase
MDDGILQRTWHELNQFLHLCGVGVTGVVQWDLCRSEEAWRALRSTAHEAGTAMADELSLPHPKHITTLKPSGTLSKLCDVSEGIHAPLGRYIFNNTNFGSSDPLVEKLRAANYQVTPNPLDPEAVLVRFPVEFPGAELVNTESAVSQLERYKLLMLNYVDSNASNTISYSPAEVPEIVDWLHENWDVYVGVSFIYRTDPTKTAQDLGYAYLPQEVVTEETFRAYADTLLPVDLDSDTGEDLIDEACAGGACPVR